MEQKIPREYINHFIAEFLGTGLLSLTLSAVIFGNSLFPSVYQPLYTPFIVGIVVALLVYLFGSISGAHFNPAVSVALWSVHKLKITPLVIHLIAQILGAYLGVQFSSLMLSPTGISIPFNNGLPAILGEFIGAFILMLAITSVVLGKINQTISGIAIGMALCVGITISLVASGGILNPAIALALSAFQIPYLLAPFLGAIAAAFLISWLHSEREL